jgi:hypothetical protein
MVVTTYSSAAAETLARKLPRYPQRGVYFTAAAGLS